ncbi:hypothetical protein QEN19_004150 [Hanseniaspora menglaensis]
MFSLRLISSGLLKTEVISTKRLFSTALSMRGSSARSDGKTYLDSISGLNKPTKIAYFHTKSIQNYKTPKYDWVPVKTTKNYLQEIERDESETTTASIARYIIWVLLFMIPLVALKLGFWQYERLKWKVDLIANCEERMYMPPLEQDTLIDSFTLKKDLNELQFLAKDKESFEEYVFEFNSVIDKNYQYRRVALVGEWDYSSEMFVGPRVKNGHKGYKLFTPFVLRGGEHDGERLLVERGWISDKNSVPYLRTLQHLSCPQGVVKISVFMKAAKKLGHGQMERGDSNGRVWQLIEWPDMLKQGDCKLPLYCQEITDLYDHNWKIEEIQDTALHFETKEPKNKSWFAWFKKSKKEFQDDSLEENSFFVSKTANKKLIMTDKADKSLEFDEQQFIKAGVPIGEPPEVKYTNDHFQYMVTWFLLAATSGTALIIFLMKNKKNGLLKVSNMRKARQKRSEKIFGK